MLPKSPDNVTKVDGYREGNSNPTVLENGMSSIACEPTSLWSNSKELDHDQVAKLEFRTPEEADIFYWNFGRQNGFDVRKCHKKTIRGVVKNVEWVCSRAGFKKSPKYASQLRGRRRKEMRCGCKARFRVAHDRHDGLYKVTNFVYGHNHPLESHDTARHLRCNRYIGPSEKDIISGLTSSGISPAKAIDYLEYIEGGAGKVAFRRKDVYNYLNKQRMQMIREGDVNTALSMLEGMKLFDKDMVFEYSVDEDQVLTRLFWTDGLSRAEFNLFGDVLLFDSTYKTNAYRFPLVIMSGINNHFNTCVFGAALLYNETIESYQWLLQNFRKAMSGKMPVTVLTDQDAAMRAAIEIEFPLAKHRICSWHLERNALQNTHKPVFARDMAQLIKKKYSIEEFHTSWYSLIEKYALSENPWVVDIFQKKESWGEAYFRGHFCGMTTTTQRSESINSFLKLSLKQRMKLTELLKHYYLWIQKLRAKFFRNQRDSEKPRPSSADVALQPLESHAASIFTESLFEMVCKEIRKEQDLVVREAIDQDGCLFTFKFGSYPKPDCRDYSVKIDWLAQKFECECEKLESDGLPCRHLISAFKHLGLKELPEKCIKQRWTIAVGKELREIFPSEFPFEDEQRKRFAILNRECVSLCLQASQSELTTSKAIMHIRKLVKNVEEDNIVNLAEENVRGVKEKEPSIGDPKRHNSCHNVCDPTKVRSRGAPRAKKQNCRKCGEPGHKSSTCKLTSEKTGGHE